MLVPPRGTPFYGGITEVKATGRPEKSSQMTLVFDAAGMPCGEDLIAVLLTAIDDSHSARS